MDETSLRAELERALSAEPPLGNLVGRSLRTGRKFRQRRRAAAAALCAAAAAVVIAVPMLLSGAGHKVSKAEPAAVAARTAYVSVGTDAVVPISLATNAVGTPIRVPLGTQIWGGATTSAVVTPDGRIVYEVGETTGIAVTPIDTATNEAGPTITLSTASQPEDIAIDPNGKTAYVSFVGGVVPINIAANAAGEPIGIPGDCTTMAFTPDGKTLYVLNGIPAGGNAAPTVTPILTASNTALAPISLPAIKGGIAYDMAITPDGKTAYVVEGVGGSPYGNFVIPIDLATSTALAPVRILASGQLGGIVISPRGGTAYVLTSRAVTPIDTATNQAGPAINLPKSAGYANNIRLAPNGKTIYVLTPRGVVPVRTASRGVLPMISIPDLPPFTDFEITPDGRTVYVVTNTGVQPISTATNSARNPVNLSTVVRPQPCRRSFTFMGKKINCLQPPGVVAFAR